MEGIACLYAPSIPSLRSLLWQEMKNYLTKDRSWIVVGGGEGIGFNMTKRLEDKSQDCGRMINDLEMVSSQ